MSKPNPRYSNGSARRRLRKWLRGQGRPCWICVAFGKSGDIDYSLPAGHPLSFEVDELVPVSLGGDPLDPRNVDAAHRCCNQWRGAMTVEQVMAEAACARGAGAPRRDAEGCTSRDW